MQEIDANEIVKKEKINSVAPEGSASTRKPSMLSRLARTFFAGDMEDIKRNAKRIAVDRLMDMFYQLTNESIQRLFWGDGGPTYGVTRKNNVDNASWYGGTQKNQYHKASSHKNSAVVRTDRAGFEYNEIIFDNALVAKQVLEEMVYYIGQYGIVSVMDYYMASHLPVPDYTYDNYGWTDLGNPTIKSVAGGGYIIDLPRAMPIKKI